MRNTTRRIAALLIGSLLLPTAAAAQFPGVPNSRQNPEDTVRGLQFNIKRRRVTGTVKSLNAQKQTLVLETVKGKDAKDVPVDVGPSLIRAGNGHATYADIQVGDRITVYGETTVQGGIRAMEMTLPKERMSIPPPDRKREAEARREIDRKLKEEARQAREEEKKAREAEKKAAAEKKRAGGQGGGEEKP